jgi:hypothetical protein
MIIQRGIFEYSTAGKLPSNAQNCSQFILAKMLLGNFTIKNNRISYKQTTNYSTLTPTVQTDKNTKAFINFLKSEGIGKTQLGFIKKVIPDNRPFFEDLVWEYSNYFYQTGKGSHTSAFIFLYRIIERISYSVPALYFSCSNDYYATFTDLYKILNDKGQGELGFLKKFLKQNSFLSSSEKSVLFDLNFTSSHGLESKYFDTIENIIARDLYSKDKTILNMKIEFLNILELFKNIRNRFFHFRTGDGQNNIKSRDIENSDELFSILNPIFCSFSSFIALRSISKKYQ